MAAGKRPKGREDQLLMADVETGQSEALSSASLQSHSRVDMATNVVAVKVRYRMVRQQEGGTLLSVAAGNADGFVPKG